MQVQTILNRVQKQPGFVYDAIHLVESGGRVQLEGDKFGLAPADKAAATQASQLLWLQGLSPHGGG